MTPFLERLVGTRAGVWLPLVLHWGWEADDDFAALRVLADLLAPVATDWTEFLAAAG